jgi:methylase of polypeptide subunit release factors
MPQDGGSGRVEAHVDAGPGIDDLEGIALLRGALVDAGYTPDAVREALATEVAAGRDSAELPLYLHMLEGGGALAALIKLFLLDIEVTADEAEEALPGLVDRLEEMGVLERRGEAVKALIEIVPTETLLLACDAFQKELATADHVLGVSAPARVLAWLTVREPVERALDLGTGNGHHALLAARHAEQTTAIDINPRALRFARFNAIMNGAPIDFREGSLFEPVAGETFDLIVSNPPYVISPESEIAYRDSGMPGDSFSETIVRRLPAHLEPGGIGVVLISWLHPWEADWTLPVRGWLEGAGCDAILLRYAVHAPLDYAAAWNRPYRGDPEKYGAGIARWAEYFDRLGIEAISWGAIVLRRRDGDNWFFPYSSTSDHITGASEQLLRLIAAQDFLAEAGREELLDAVMIVAPEHRIDQKIRLQDGGELIERNILRLERGLCFEVSIDAFAERVLALLDGVRTLRDVLVEAAAEFEAPLVEFVDNSIPVMRRLVELGFAIPLRPSALD